MEFISCNYDWWWFHAFTNYDVLLQGVSSQKIQNITAPNAIRITLVPGKTHNLIKYLSGHLMVRRMLTRRSILGSNSMIAQLNLNEWLTTDLLFSVCWLTVNWPTNSPFDCQTCATQTNGHTYSATSWFPCRSQKFKPCIFLDVQNATNLWRVKWSQLLATLSIRNASRARGARELDFRFWWTWQFIFSLIISNGTSITHLHTLFLDARTRSPQERELRSLVKTVCVRNVSRRRNLLTWGSKRSV